MIWNRGDGMSRKIKDIPISPLLEKTALKPCPFCGGTKVHMYSFKNSDLHGFIHTCEINGDAMVKVESRLFATDEEAINAWNRRVTE